MPNEEDHPSYVCFAIFSHVSDSVAKMLCLNRMFVVSEKQTF
jgi:hypothetical protein